MLIAWLAIGIYIPAAAVILIPVIFYLLLQKRIYDYVFISFFFILILSDSRLGSLAFIASVKEIFMALLILFIFLKYREIGLHHPFFKYFIAFFILATALTLRNNHILISIQKTFSYVLVYFIVPVLFLKAYEQKDQFIRKMILSVTLLLIIGLLFRIISPNIVVTLDRFNGLLGNPNGLGIFCTLFFILFRILTYLYPELLNKNEKVLIWASIIISIYLSKSRSAILAIIIFIIFQYFHKISPMLGAILWIVILISYEMIINNLETIIIALGLQEYFRIETLETGSGRLIAWQFAWDHIKDHFFFGKGISYTEYLYKENYTKLSILGHQGNAHNSYLTFWLDTGLVGLVLFLGGLFSSFIKAAKISRLALPAMYSILFSIYTESWLTASLNPYTIQFLMILTLLLSDQFIPKDQLNDNQSPEQSGQLP